MSDHDHPYMPLYFGDLLKQTLFWSGEERSLLILLLAAQWWNGPLPLDLSKLAAAIQYDVKTFLALWNGRVHALFDVTADGYVNADTEERRRSVARMSSVRRAAGQASGKARRARADQSASPLFEQNKEQDVRTKSRTSSAPFARTPIQSNPIQSRPIQEPQGSAPPDAGGDISPPALPSGADPPPAATADKHGNGQKRAAPRSRRLPPDHPTEPFRAWAREHTPGVNFDAELAVLRDHEFRDPHSDWDGVIRNWLRRAAKQTSRRNGEQLTRFEQHKRRLYGGG